LIDNRQSNENATGGKIRTLSHFDIKFEYLKDNQFINKREKVVKDAQIAFGERQSLKNKEN